MPAYDPPRTSLRARCATEEPGHAHLASVVALSWEMVAPDVFGSQRATDRLTPCCSLARKEMSAASQAEFEYRRSIRQISLGMVPAVVIATAAAQVVNWSGSHDVAPPILLGLLYLAVGAVVACGLMSTAAYQENVGQWLLLDLAFSDTESFSG